MDEAEVDDAEVDEEEEKEEDFFFFFLELFWAVVGVGEEVDVDVDVDVAPSSWASRARAAKETDDAKDFVVFFGRFASSGEAEGGLGV